MKAIEHTDIGQLTVGPSELARLFSRSPGTIHGWMKTKGLPVNAEGRYNVRAAILWYENYLRTSKRPPVKLDALDQQQLTVFLGKSRQWLTARTKHHAMPRREDGKYNLRDVCRWLARHYAVTEKARYERRLNALRMKLKRNTAQLLRFIDKEAKP